MPLSRRSLLFAPLCGLAQEPRFSAEVKVVTVFATVRDRNGKLVSDLSREDFELAEDGRRQQIRYFSRETDLPLTIGILIDTSRSQYGILESERRASFAFLDRVLREDKDRAFVLKFDVAVTMLQQLTSSRKELREALRAADLPKRDPNEAEPPRSHILVGTRMYDAVVRSSRLPMAQQQGRKALILLTDGMDARSRHTLPDAIEQAQRADTLVYSILYADPNGYAGQPRDYRTRLPMPVAKRGIETLRGLSTKTGGGFYLVSKEDPIDRILDRIQEELRSQYSMGYTSDRPESKNSYRKIRLTTPGKKLTVQAREGYYA